MISFAKIIELIESEGVPEDNSIKAIRNGLSIKETFWDDFLSVLNSSEAMSELLDVPIHKISEWRKNILENLDKIKKIDSDVSVLNNTKLIKTGLPNLEKNENI